MDIWVAPSISEFLKTFYYASSFVLVWTIIILRFAKVWPFLINNHLFIEKWLIHEVNATSFEP